MDDCWLTSHAPRQINLLYKKWLKSHRLSDEQKYKAYRKLFKRVADEAEASYSLAKSKCIVVTGESVYIYIYRYPIFSNTDTDTDVGISNTENTEIPTSEYRKFGSVFTSWSCELCYL